MCVSLNYKLFHVCVVIWPSCGSEEDEQQVSDQQLNYINWHPVNKYDIKNTISSRLTPRHCGPAFMKTEVMSSILVGAAGGACLTGGGACVEVGVVSAEVAAEWRGMDFSSWGITWVTTTTPPILVTDVDVMIEVRGHRCSEGILRGRK